MADRSCVHPLGVVEDVLVNVGVLVFPVDFYILEMEHDNNFVPILLGRPFLKTASTKINVSTGSLTMEFDGKIIHYNIHKAMELPFEEKYVLAMDILDSRLDFAPCTNMQEV